MLDFDWSRINFGAVAVSALATFFIGAIWYTVLFGHLWRTLHGYSAERLLAMQARRPMPVFFGILLVCYFVIATVLAALILVFPIDTPADGAMLGIVIWVIVAAVEMTGHVSSDRVLGVYLIDVSYEFIYLVMMGAILGGWK